MRMMSMPGRLRDNAVRFLADERGGTAIEYALIAGAIFMVIVAVVASIGTNLSNRVSPVVAGLQ